MRAGKFFLGLRDDEFKSVPTVIFFVPVDRFGFMLGLFDQILRLREFTSTPYVLF